MFAQALRLSTAEQSGECSTASTACCYGLYSFYSMLCILGGMLLWPLQHVVKPLHPLQHIVRSLRHVVKPLHPLQHIVRSLQHVVRPLQPLQHILRPLQPLQHVLKCKVHHWIIFADIFAHILKGKLKRRDASKKSR